MDKLHNMAVFFNYSTRCKELFKFANVVDFAQVRLKTDISTTRVSARFFLIDSVLRVHKGLLAYKAANSSNKKVTWKLCEDDLVTAAEFLAVLESSSKVATLAQTEVKFTSALSLPLRERMMEDFRSATIQVVDLANVTASPKMPRISKEVKNMTEVGKEALRRATLEGERR